MKLPKTPYAGSVLLLFLLLVAGLGLAQVPDPPAPLPPPLSADHVRLDPRLFTDFVRDRAAAVRLGKVLFWDMQIGSDVQACASCHFHAGADNRFKNQLSPSGAPPAGFADPPRTDFFSGSGPDSVLGALDFPRPKANDDVTSSQGVAHIEFLGMVPSMDGDGLEDLGLPLGDDVFQSDGIQLRRVEPRNTPTTINAVFNLRNFWDGRANFIFNGVNPFGNRDPDARILVDDVGELEHVRIAIDFASLASQAVGPPESDFEMSFVGRRLRDIGKKMLSRKPLAMQLVHPADSELGAYSAYPENGLDTTLAAMIEEAFYPRYWRSDELTDGYSHKEYNFSFFFGVSVMLYEATQISGEAPVDAFLGGDTSALTPRQQLGLDVFRNEGKCINCHKGPEFSAAASVQFAEREENGLVERMLMGDQDRGPALYDNAFYNIGVRQTEEDIGLGGEDPFGNPLSFTLQYLDLLQGRDVPDPFEINPCTFEIPFDPAEFPPGTVFRDTLCADGSLRVEPIAPEEVVENLRTAVQGAFKVPNLRNIDLTGPYFHNGGQATLRQVVEFYNRGGDFPNENQNDLDPDIEQLNLSEEQKEALVDFMLSMTDERVRHKRAPFDHPQLFVPNGHAPVEDRGDGVARDRMVEIPAVGADGELLDGEPGPALQPFLCLDPFELTATSAPAEPCGPACDEAITWDARFDEPAGSDPADWLDTGPGNALTEQDNFKTTIFLGQTALGTTSNLTNLHSHFVPADQRGKTWSNFTLTGKLAVTDQRGGVGVTLLSDFPDSDAYYRLRRHSGFRELHLSSHGTAFLDCDTPDTGVDPLPNRWYEFRIEVENRPHETRLRTRVWSEGSREPTGWQQQCSDGSPTRLTSGTVGVWSMGSGGKYWDSLAVRDGRTTCYDGLFCNGEETCIGGVCLSGPPPCGMTEQCDEPTASCLVPDCSVDGDCDDGNLCTDDRCIAGACDLTAVDCSVLDDQCSAGICDPADGGCDAVPANEGGTCDDGDPATTNDRCQAGDCAGDVVCDPVLDEDFESFAPGSDPAGWLDTGAGNSLDADDNFRVADRSGQRVLGTTSTLTNIHSHVVAGGSADWTDYRYSGRFLLDTARGGIGMTLASGYPGSDAYYRLRRYSGFRQLHLSSHGTAFLTCDTPDSGVDPAIGVWYRFAIEVENAGTETLLRANVWVEGTPEPAGWQQQCSDASPTRLTGGTVGVWSMGSGGKFWDDLVVDDCPATD